MDRRALPLGAMLGAALILLLTPAVACAASAWPMFGHDAAHSRRSQYVGAQTATVKWATDLVPAAGWIHSSPALAADGTVYITVQDFSAPGQLQLYALDPSTGQVVWHADAGDAHGSSPAVDPDGYIYVGGNLLSAPANQRGKVFAFAPGGGAPIWTYSAGSAFYSSPTVAGGAIYIGCDDGNLDSLSPLGDHLSWGVPINASGEVESSAAVDGSGALYVGGAGKMVSLQTASNGSLRWSAPTSGSGLYVQSSPALSNDGAAVYFTDDRGTVYARATTDGHELWTYSGLGTVRASGMPSSPGVAADGTVYVGGANGKVYAIGANGGFKWSYATGGAVYSSPAIGADGTIYIGSDDYKIYALDGATGACKWAYATGAPVESSPAVGADGTIYVGSEDGKLYAIGGGSAPAACSLSTPTTSGALKHTVAVTYSGKLSPAHVAKVTLMFQKKAGSKWKTVASPAVTTKATGVWTCKKKLAAGTYHLRASTAASTTFKGASSKWKAFVIK